MEQAQTALGLQAELGRLGDMPPPMMAQANVNINQVENGYVINVGCKQFVTQHLEEMLEGLRLYFTKPEEARKKYMKPVETK